MTPAVAGDAQPVGQVQRPDGVRVDRALATDEIADCADADEALAGGDIQRRAHDVGAETRIGEAREAGRRIEAGGHQEQAGRADVDGPIRVVLPRARRKIDEAVGPERGRAVAAVDNAAVDEAAIGRERSAAQDILAGAADDQGPDVVGTTRFLDRGRGGRIVADVLGRGYERPGAAQGVGARGSGGRTEIEPAGNRVGPARLGDGAGARVADVLGRAGSVLPLRLYVPEAVGL